MALRFRELPWYVQTGLYFLVAIGIGAAGYYLEFSPVRQALNEKEEKVKTYQGLVAEVSKLQAVKQQHEVFRARLLALDEQLARVRTLVPEEKQTDEFMRLLQSASVGTQVALRRLTSRDAVIKEFYAEMPFEVELDGAYSALLDFYRRLGGTTRIINAGGLKLKGVETGRGKYEYAPGTTVAGVCTVTTYYTPTEAELAAAAPPSPAQKAPPRQPRRPAPRR